jgi:hypothetical protein
MPVQGGRSVRLSDVARATPADTVAALRVAAAHPPLLRAVLGKAPLALGGGAGWIALNLLGASEQPFGAAALSFGILQAVRGAGTGIGPALASRALRAGVSAAWLDAAARAGMLVAVASLAIVRSPAGLAALALLWGMGGGSNWVLQHSALQRHAGDHVIGRLAAFDELLVTLPLVRRNAQTWPDSKSPKMYAPCSSGMRLPRYTTPPVTELPLNCGSPPGRATCR